MVELLLICAVGALGVGFTASMYRWLAARPAGEPELVRMGKLVFGGVTAYLRRQSVVAGAVAGVVGALVLVSYGVAHQLDGEALIDPLAIGPREQGLWATGTFLFGALGALASAWVAAWSSRQACARLAASARRSLDDALQVALRGGAITGVFALAVSLLGVGAAFGVAYLTHGGTDDAAVAWASAPRFPLLIGGFALGAGVVAMLSQVGGGVFGNVADIGADVAGKLEGTLAADDPDNPATLADLVGDHVGEGASRAALVFATIALEVTVAMLIGTRLYLSNPDLVSITAVVLLPLVAHAFSLISAFFGVAVVRTDDTEVPMTALSRGLHITAILFGVGAVGSVKWLLGAHWIAFGGSLLIGAVGSLLLFYAVQYYSEAKYRPVRMLAEVARGGATLGTLRGFVTAGEGTAAVVVVLALVGVGTFTLGESSDLDHGGLYGVTLGLVGLMGAIPYVLAMASLGAIADTAGGLIDLTPLRERADVRARARLLDAVGTSAKSFARVLSTVTSTLTSFLVGSALLMQVSSDGSMSLTLEPTLFIGGLAGLVAVLMFNWVVLRRVIAAGRDVVNELRVQLRTVAAERATRGLSQLAADGADGAAEAPSREKGQLDCVEIVSRAALRSIIVPALVGIGLPLLFGVGLRLWATEDTLATSVEAIVAFLIVATVTSSTGSLLGNQAGTAWDNAKKYIETGAHGGRFILDPKRAGGEQHNPTYVAAIIGDTIGDPLKGTLGPAAQALALTLAALAFVLLPFFT